MPLTPKSDRFEISFTTKSSKSFLFKPSFDYVYPDLHEYKDHSSFHIFPFERNPSAIYPSLLLLFLTSDINSYRIYKRTNSGLDFSFFE